MSWQELELLAPVGKLEVLPGVVAAGADAVYLGGKKFNMRALRKEFNLTDEELKYAVEFVHNNNRKIYITVNNLYDNTEISEIMDYLLLLRDLGIDALIVQDLGIVKLCRKLDIGIPLHASVQMGIESLEAVKFLEEQGFERVILSRNVSLAETAAIAGGTNIGIEAFAHGETCIAHTGQCYMSSFVARASGNRGRCCKPCRWQYELLGSQANEFTGFYNYLSVNDLCLYSYLPDMIKAGICSFKIEGRMRKAEFLTRLISTYRQALDKYITDPDAYETDANSVHDLQQRRVRDFTIGNFKAHLDWTAIGFDGQREPPLISTAIKQTPLQLVDPVAMPAISADGGVPQLTVKVGGLKSLGAIMEAGVDNVILGSDIIRQNRENWSWLEIRQAVDMLEGSSVKVLLETPRIVGQADLAAIYDLKKLTDSTQLWGVVVNDMGSLNVFKDSGLQVWAGYGLNIFNSPTATFFKNTCVSRITASLELTADSLKSLLGSGMPVEIMVHGPLSGMISDFCPIRAAQSDREEECSHYCLQDEYALRDEWGQQYKIITDANCRSYIFFPYELCLLAYVPFLNDWGAASLRIEGQYYNPRQLRQVVDIYLDALRQLKEGEWQSADNYRQISRLFPDGLTAGLMRMS